MEQLPSTVSSNPDARQKAAWLGRLLTEVFLVVEASDTFDFVTEHIEDFADPDPSIISSRSKLYRRLHGLIDWYKAGIPLVVPASLIPGDE